LVEGDTAEYVLTALGRSLLTPYGLRSLSPDDPAYRGDYGGDAVRRDGGYHQGPVWTWLRGAYVEAHFRVHHDRAAALDLLHPFAHHLRDACLGSVSEILEGDAPHLPRGAVAQAWGVAGAADPITGPNEGPGYAFTPCTYEMTTMTMKAEIAIESGKTRCADESDAPTSTARAASDA